MEALETPGESEVYDSSVEEDFGNRFRALDTGWKLTREPEPVLVGRHVMIPDFGFEKADMRVYMEVVGFWTRRYLEEKVKKLGMVGDVDMIVAADRELACEKLNRIGRKLHVVYYRRRVPLKPVLAHLRAREARLVKEQVRHLRREGFAVEKPFLEVEEIAEELGVLEDAVKEVLRDREFPGYERLGDILIQVSKLEEIRGRLERRLKEGELTLLEASGIIEDTGCGRSTSILDTLGYGIEWHGIDPGSAKIRRRKSI
jgi:hypothetical protein